MSSRSRRRVRRWAIVAVIAAVIVAGVAYALRSGRTTPAAPTALPESVATPSTYASLGATSGQVPSGTSSTGTLAGAGQGGSPGINGSSWTGSTGRHTVVLRVWAATPVPAFGWWWIPATGAKGALTGQITSWSHTAVAYGSSKLGVVYASSDGRGIVVHCSVSIDGVVRASGQTHGAWGYVVCSV